MLPREYLVIEYAPGRRGQPPDRLYVPTDQLDEVTRYSGGEAPTLHRLGGADWAKAKGRARKAVRQIASELIRLYSARMASPGFAFGPDTPWQRELKDAFPYVETPDQLGAIDEVKLDMERPVPMDRLICGDVGYGKTEIAVRSVPGSEHRLPGRGGKHALERLVGELASEPLDPNHPLWTVHFVDKYEGGVAVIFRMHHAIADGMALMDVTMKLVDGPERRSGDASAEHEEEGWLQSVMAPVVAAINSGAEASSSTVKAALGLARNPLRAAGLLRDGAGVASELAYLLLMSSDSADAIQGQTERDEARRLVRADRAARGQGGQPGARMFDQRPSALLRRRLDAALPSRLRRQDRGGGMPGPGADRPARARRRRAWQPLRHHRRRAAGRHRASARAGDDGPATDVGAQDLV